MCPMSGVAENARRITRITGWPRRMHETPGCSTVHAMGVPNPQSLQEVTFFAVILPQNQNPCNRAIHKIESAGDYPAPKIREDSPSCTKQLTLVAFVQPRRRLAEDMVTKAAAPRYWPTFRHATTDGENQGLSGRHGSMVDARNAQLRDNRSQHFL